MFGPTHNERPVDGWRSRRKDIFGGRAAFYKWEEGRTVSRAARGMRLRRAAPPSVRRLMGAGVLKEKCSIKFVPGDDPRRGMSRLGGKEEKQWYWLDEPPAKSGLVLFKRGPPPMI